MNHNKLGLWLLCFTAGLIVIAVATGDLNLLTIGNKALNAALLIVFATLYQFTWLTRFTNVDKQIFQTAQGTALYIGLVWVALALALASGGF